MTLTYVHRQLQNVFKLLASIFILLYVEKCKKLAKETVREVTANPLSLVDTHRQNDRADRRCFELF